MSAALLTITASLPDGTTIADINVDMWALVGIDGRPVVVGETSDGSEVRLPVTTQDATTLIMAAAGGGS